MWGICFWFFNFISNYSLCLIFFVLVSGVQHSSQTLLQLTRWSPWYFQSPPGSIQLSSFITALTVFPELYFTPLWLFCNYQSVPLNLVTVSARSPSPPPTPGNHQSVLCIYECVSIWFVHLFYSLDSTIFFLTKIKKIKCNCQPADNCLGCALVVGVGWKRSLLFKKIVVSLAL